MKKKMLIITTKNDSSLKLFFTNKIKEDMHVTSILFETKYNYIKMCLVDGSYDYIYIRDPFNSGINENDIRKKVDLILNYKKNAYLIDNISCVDDVFFADKWNQYQKYKDLMVNTYKLNDYRGDYNNKIFKKRISSRAKGIVFDIKKVNPKEYDLYIIQDIINIQKEYRIFVLFDEIFTLAGVKSSKTNSTKVKMIETENITNNIKAFVKKILDKKNIFDFIGLDIAYDGKKLHLIEINRSCLFGAYMRITGINLAEKFIEKLLITTH